jgi:hypothetical protein
MEKLAMGSPDGATRQQIGAAAKEAIDAAPAPLLHAPPRLEIMPTSGQNAMAIRWLTETLAFRLIEGRPQKPFSLDGRRVHQ